MGPRPRGKARGTCGTGAHRSALTHRPRLAGQVAAPDPAFPLPGHVPPSLTLTHAVPDFKMAGDAPATQRLARAVAESAGSLIKDGRAPRPFQPGALGHSRHPLRPAVWHRALGCRPGPVCACAERHSGATSSMVGR